MISIILALGGVIGATPKPVEMDHRVPNFTVSDLKGKRLKLSEIAGKKRVPVVISFWCTFCESCRHVEGQLDRLRKDYRGKAIVIAVDASAGETPEDVAEFIKETGLSFPVYLDPSGKTADIFGTKVTTTTVVIDEKGILRYRGQFAQHKHAYAEEALRAVLAKKKVHLKQTHHQG